MKKELLHKLDLCEKKLFKNDALTVEDGLLQIENLSLLLGFSILDCKPRILFLRGYAYEKDQDKKKALKDYKHCIETDFNSKEMESYKRKAYWRSGRIYEAWGDDVNYSSRKRFEHYQKAQKNYQQYLKSLKTNTNSSVQNQLNALDKKIKNLDDMNTKKGTLKKVVGLFDEINSRKKRCIRADLYSEKKKEYEIDGYMASNSGLSGSENDSNEFDDTNKISKKN